MKKYGHTGTLFLQNGKYYKWSYKYNHCINCGTCKFKHKGRGLCTSCFDKERKIKNTKRLFNLKKQSFKHYYKSRILLFLEKKGYKKKQKKVDLIKYKKEYYQKNKEVLKILSNSYRLRKKGVKCLEYHINGKIKYLPFTNLDKPKTITDLRYDEWKENLKQFEIIKSFYTKK